MAEMLVQNFDNWMTRLTQEQFDNCVAEHPNFMEKYNARSKKGDIVEIQADGFWTKTRRGWDKAHYDLLVVPKLSKAEALKLYGGSLEHGENIKAKFKGNVTMTVNKEEITETAFKERVLVKTVF